MLKDPERYILTSAKVSLIRDVLSFVLAEARSEGAITPGSFPSPEAAAKGGCDRMILELRRPKEPAPGISPRVRNLRTSRLGRVLVVTGDATAPEILHAIEALRRPHFSPQLLTSSLRAFTRTLFCTLRLAHPQAGSPDLRFVRSAPFPRIRIRAAARNIGGLRYSASQQR